ncbi:putative Serine hydrolase FSH domain-containing protein [Seiridium cardinale]
MDVKVLALHGVGSSAVMLEQQLAPLIQDLGASYKFTFLDGSVSCERGPGMPPWSPGPFYSYSTGYSPSEMKEALDDLHEFICETGPYDGVCGFSQGASIAAAYILARQKQAPDGPAPFSFAVFFSSVAACSPEEGCYRELVGGLVKTCLTIPAFTVSLGNAEIANLNSDEKTFVEYMALTCHAIKCIGIRQPAIDLDCFQNADRVPRLIHPRLVEDRINIPTVHVTGKKDLEFMVAQSLVLQQLCNPQSALVHRHGQGHAIPTKITDIKAIAASIGRVAEQGRHLAAMKHILQRL